ncbi:GGDEF domain-containing protein [Vibrio algarum]|uniref:diguanylate cyclase n=1 Tax=Vibrio algarum TaxID=3020714 RepID=A0ABT4YWM7_9VIBR|nr:diguanylate cyclase [Vibrio sp. KJ40-1]MDB1125913.1 diguanylate cyclase [Vibrio sp. KJ40-1]
MTKTKPLIKRNIVRRVILGYVLALSFTIVIVFLAFTGLNKINATVDDITNRLTETRNLAQGIDNKLQLVGFYTDRYQRLYHQVDLDSFNEKVLDLKASLDSISVLISDEVTLDMVHYIQRETDIYLKEFEEITKLIMYQQSLLSTIFLKQELLVENQLSAIRINVGIVQVPDIYFSFGNARASFELMRLQQSKYLSKNDEKYFVMFKNNYELSTDAFSDLIQAMTKASIHSDIVNNAMKAQEELRIYYNTFLDIHRANISLRRLSKKLDDHELKVVQTSSKIAMRIEDEYKKGNNLTQELVRTTQLQLLAAVIIAILINLALIYVVLRKIIAPIFQELQDLSNLDGLTQVANRRAFDIGLEREGIRAKREGKPLSLIMCDVDYFKKYNDEYGHQLGDLCLKRVAASINNTCNRPEHFVARYGGEEFVIILPNTSAKMALDIAEKMRLSIEGLKVPHRTSSINAFVTISMGVATMTDKEEIPTETLISYSDRALYKAKRNNRNCVLHYNDI